MDLTGLRITPTSSAHSLLSNTTTGPSHPGMIPAAIYPQPGRAGIPAAPRLPEMSGELSAKDS